MWMRRRRLINPPAAAIVSKDGAIIRGTNDAVALMRDPDGVYLEVMTPPKQ